MRTVQLSESVYIRMVYGAGSPGVCLSCGDVDEYAGCEPDARGYECPQCEARTLYGLEEALTMGHLDITDDPGGADE